MMHPWKSKQQAALLAIACFSAVLCFQGLSWDGNSAIGEINNSMVDDAEKTEYESQMHRHLLATLDESNLMESEQKPQGDDPGIIEEGRSTPALSSPIGTKPISPFLSSLTLYTLEDAISEATPFRSTFAVMVYDPSTDSFLAYHSKDHMMKSSYVKVASAIRHLSFMLRKVFPERFTPSSEEFAVAISSGDYPHVRVGSIPHACDRFHSTCAPILQFGSVFRNDKLYPNLVAMPMPELHLPCFAFWSDKGQVCNEFRAMPDGALAFGKELGLEWEDLKPQVVWRGSDYSYLNGLIKPNYRSPTRIGTMENELNNLDQQREDKGQAAANVLRKKFSTLLPRWKGVVLAMEAELSAQEGELPWANIKFAEHSKDSDKHHRFKEKGISVIGGHIGVKDLAKHKYLIDIGGGGGTTWTGTSSKLPMPGLLFHHITPTKDYFHDRIKPYVHYVPISPDLSDLKEKFDWAENHSNSAKQISDQATEFMRYLGTPEGFGHFFKEDFVEPLRKIIEAYQPISSTHPGKSWRDVLEPPEGSDMVRVLECRGLAYKLRASCTEVGGELVERWRTTGRYTADTEQKNERRKDTRRLKSWGKRWFLGVL